MCVILVFVVVIGDLQDMMILANSLPVHVSYLLFVDVCYNAFDQS